MAAGILLAAPIAFGVAAVAGENEAHSLACRFDEQAAKAAIPIANAIVLFIPHPISSVSFSPL